MLRHYGRLGIITAVLVIFLILLSLSSLQTSQASLGATSHLSGEEILGSKFGEAFASKHDTPNAPGVVTAPEREQEGSSQETLPENAPLDEETKPETTPLDEATKPENTLLDAETKSPEDTAPDNASKNEEDTDDSSLSETIADTEEEEHVVKTPTSKIIVVGQLSSENTNWVREEMLEWQNAIYYVDLPDNATSPSGLKTKMNKAKEATPYLTYIVDNYPDFPDVMVFIHAHRRGMPEAWHNDAPNYDAVNMLNALRLDTVLDRGYVNLRCNNEVGCPDEVQPFRDPPSDDKEAEHAYPYVYANFFNATFAEMKEQIPIVATQCCAQFAVSKEQMLQKPKSEYERYLTFIEETHYDDDVAGRVLEYMWHIIFGREAVHCENVFECWCAVYGRCRQSAGAGRLSHHGGGAFGP
ncbi:uncharacterized protein LTR77_010465 [Saxophila tyrrhenica]|uniref:Uncharacterized protein n=1 Tax=Saxophila tyrrhenica TaxID=1690608 RepID=A0AAV9NW09_9PEZI|nr:hypothetical protein LTR77_010465 [Saxophila tyrrhenica]